VGLVSSVFQMTVPPELREQTAGRMESFLAETSHIVAKSNGKTVDVRAAVLQLSLGQTGEETGVLTVELKAHNGPAAGIKEVLAALGLEKELFVTLFPVRIRCRLENETMPVV